MATRIWHLNQRSDAGSHPCLLVMQFVDIPRVIETVMEAHKADFAATPSIEDIVNVSPTVKFSH